MEASESRGVETFTELVGRGLSTLEAVALWLREREGRLEVRPTVADLVVVTVHTHWHILAVPAKNVELAISQACRRVDELLLRDFAHLQAAPDGERPEPL